MACLTAKGYSEAQAGYWAIRLVASWNLAWGANLTHWRDEHRKHADSFGKEVGFTGTNLQVLAKMWRTHQSAAEANFANQVILPEVASALTLLNSLNPVTKEKVWASLTHMTLNRIFRVRAREQEAVIHHWMQRLYAKQEALIQKSV